jgi:hypothetical protein
VSGVQQLEYAWMIDDLKAKIITAAMRVDEPEGWRAMRSGVQAFIEAIDVPMLKQLAHCLDEAPRVPSSFRPEQAEPGRSYSWRCLWTEAVCEVFYLCRENSVAPLRTVAFSPSDAGLGTAFYLLCRLAAQGYEREQFFEDVKREFQRMSPQNQLFIVDAVISQGIRNDACIGRDASIDKSFAAKVEQLDNLPDWCEAKEQLWALGEDV